MLIYKQKRDRIGHKRKWKDVNGMTENEAQSRRANVLNAACEVFARHGYQKASMQDVASAAGMSKSGVFAHFGSREELQVSVIREYHHCFEQEVFYPAMSAPRGVQRLRALFDNWMKRTSIEIDSGCIYISGAIEFDDRTGPVRDALAHSVLTWHAAMKRAITQAKDLGQIRSDVVEDQMLFEVHGLILALHYEARFLKNPGSIARALTGFDNILARFSAPAPAAAPSPVSHPTSKE